MRPLRFGHRLVSPASFALSILLVSAVAFADHAKPRPTAKAVAAHAAAPKPAASPRYAHYVKTWHQPAPGKSPSVDDAGRPLLALFSLNTNDRIEVGPIGENGGFTASALDRAAFVLREPSSGNEHPIEPRLLDAVYRIQAHFHAQEVRVISGYRTPHGRGSNHGKGRAIDLVIPGASDEDVAKFARELGFCGVGVYPESGFVHVDVRERSYFWVDASGPGRRNRERGVLGDLAQKSDAQALARGERPTPVFAIAQDVDAALKARAALPSAAAADEDDDLD